MRETRRLTFEVKTVDEQGVFEGYASVNGNEDRAGEVIDSGAFKKTLKEQKSFPIYWLHEWQDDPAAMPIGVAVCEEDGYGLKVLDGRLNLASPRVRDEIYPLMKLGIIREMSIAFKTIKDVITTGVRHIKEVRLIEVTLAPAGFACNPLAQVTGVKTNMNTYELKTADLATTLAAAVRQADLQRVRWKLDDSLNEVISNLQADATMTTEQKTAALSASLDQYKTLMLDWFTRLIGTVDDGSNIAAAEATLYKACGACLDIATLGIKVNPLVIKQAHNALDALLKTREPDTTTPDGQEPQSKGGADLSALLAEAKTLPNLSGGN
jgi:HK97 family phage prohead protease